MLAVLKSVSPSLEKRIRLKPLIKESVQKFLNQSDLIHQLIDGFGSPLNIVFPDNIEDNLKGFQDVYKKHLLRGRIYFTSKPCKSKALIRKASLYDVGIDVSSSKSLDHALSSGFSCDRIEATGPKNIDYILKCLQLDILLNVDSISELHTILALRNKLGLPRKARLMLRLTGFSSQGVHFTPQDGTFGTHISEIPPIIDWLVVHKEEIDFKGFSFHINDFSEQQKLVAIENTLELTFLALKKGLKPKGIDIGGGYSIQYAKDADEYADYIECLKQSVLGKIESQVWNNGGLGYKECGGVVVGAPSFMNHVPKLTKEATLDYLLSQRSRLFGNAKNSDIIRDSLLELYIEPGRAMLDQCGVTLSTVTQIKESINGELLVSLEMNRSNNHSLNIKNLCEPILIPRDIRNNKSNQRGCYFIGHLCLSYDILQYNKIYLDILPNIGDVIAFTNTAPYMMDFTESETLMHPVANKVALWQENNQFKWAMDEKYLPLNIY